MDVEIVVRVLTRASLVAAPAFILGGWAWIRADALRDRPPRARLDLILTAAMWGHVAISVALTAAGLLLWNLVPLLVGFALSEARQRIAPLFGEPDPRWVAGRAARALFERAGSPFPIDREAFRRDLDALEAVVTPTTFEYVQLVRALLGHWLEGLPMTEAQPQRWRARLTEIAATWWPPGTRPGRSPRRRIGAWATRAWLPISAGGGVVLGAWTYERLGLVPALAGVAIAWLLVWTPDWRSAAVALLGLVAGLAGATIRVLATCPTCDASSFVSTVLGIAVVGISVAAGLVWRGRTRPRPVLRALPVDDQPPTIQLVT